MMMITKSGLGFSRMQITHELSSVFFSHQSYSIALRHINAINPLANLRYMNDDPGAVMARFDRYSPQF
jgi:hypothetical protein